MPGRPRSKRICNHGPTNTFVLTTPIGALDLISCPRGLHSLGMVTKVTDEQFSPQPGDAVEMISQLYQDNGYTYKPALLAVQWLQAYFHDCSNLSAMARPPFCMTGKATHGVSFTEKVWQSLADQVTFGQTVSYSSLAKLCGNPKACRAVGQAMRNNPFQIIVPCHRVIPSSGGVGNYSGGERNHVKAWLLKHEGAFK